MHVGVQVDAMSADDRGQLLLYFAAHVPGGLQTQDVDLLLRLPIFPGIAHTSQSPVWRPLIGTASSPILHVLRPGCYLIISCSAMVTTCRHGQGVMCMDHGAFQLV